MTIELLGSAGLGLLWGWLLGYLDRTAVRPVRSRLFALAATFAPAGAAWAAGDGPGLTAFAAAAVVALSLHLSWRRSLSRLYGSSP